MTLDDVCRVLFAFNVKHILKWWTQCAGRIYTNSTHISEWTYTITHSHNIVWSLSSSLRFMYQLSIGIFAHVCVCVYVCIRMFHDHKLYALGFVSRYETYVDIFLLWPATVSSATSSNQLMIFFFICPKIIKGSISFNFDRMNHFEIHRIDFGHKQTNLRRSFSNVFYICSWSNILESLLGNVMWFSGTFSSSTWRKNIPNECKGMNKYIAYW